MFATGTTPINTALSFHPRPACVRIASRHAPPRSLTNHCKASINAGKRTLAPTLNAVTGSSLSVAIDTSTDVAPIVKKEELEPVYPYACLAKLAYEELNLDTITETLEVWHKEFATSRATPTGRVNGKDKIRWFGFRSVKSDTEVFGFMKKDGELIFAFRGTEVNERGDRIADLAYRQTDITGMYGIEEALKTDGLDRRLGGSLDDVKVHRGFLAGFNAIMPGPAAEGENDGRHGPLYADLLELTAALQKDSGITAKKITCCGHSLGGALATLGAFYFGAMKPEVPINCITFGCPRVGNSKFVEACSKTNVKFQRFMHRNDGVPCVPMSWMTVAALQWGEYVHTPGGVSLCQPLNDPLHLLPEGRTAEEYFVGVTRKDKYVAVRAHDPPPLKQGLWGLDVVYDHSMDDGYLAAFADILDLPSKKKK